MEATETKVCSKCGSEKNISDFYFRKDRNGYVSTCNSCRNSLIGERRKAAKREYLKKYYNENKQVILKNMREYAENNKQNISIRKRDWYINNLRHMMWKNAKRRAKDKGIDFSIKEEDIVITDVCPVLGIPLIVGVVRNDNSPTLDRIDNTKGYIVGNIRVISWRANRIKGDATSKEISLVLEYMKREGV